MDFFRLRRVELVGVRYLDSADVLAALAVDTTMSVWDPTVPMARRVAARAGVRSAAVHRKLPGTIVVEIEERVPVALIPTAEGIRAFDEHGLVLPFDPTRSPVDAPILASPDTALLRLLAEIRVRLPALYARTSEVSRHGREELLLRLDTVPVRAMADVTVDQLAEIDPVEADLARAQQRVTEIDLRYRDQVIARLQ
jgi:cell division protein FtsQ